MGYKRKKQTKKPSIWNKTKKYSKGRYSLMFVTNDKEQAPLISLRDRYYFRKTNSKTNRINPTNVGTKKGKIAWYSRKK